MRREACRHGVSPSEPWLLPSRTTPAHPAKPSSPSRKERLARVPAYPHIPVALTEDQPIRTASIEAALAELAHSVGASLPVAAGTPRPGHPAQGPPRFRALPGPAAVGHDSQGAADYVTAITTSLLDLDQFLPRRPGPAGDRQDLRRFARHCHIGAGGLEDRRGGAVARRGGEHAVHGHRNRRGGSGPGRQETRRNPHPVPWRRTSDDDVAALLASPGGCLVGGTAWTMTGKSVPAGSLDLLVIDEAGQFSLANTLAVARSANRLLLLGDPAAAAAGHPGFPSGAGGRVGPGLARRRARHAARRTWATSWRTAGACIPSCAVPCPS